MTSGASPIDQIHETAAEVLGSWHPDNPAEFDAGMAAFERLFEEVGASITQLADRLGSDFPVEPGTRDAVAELGASAAGLSDAAQEIYTTHRTEHEKEMEREENPRVGEEMWDIRGGR